MSVEKKPRPPVSLGKRILFALLPLVLLLGLGELAARFLPGDLKSDRFFYVAGGHEEYFGTTKVSIPYRVLPPYYWVPAPRTPITNNKGFRGRDWTENKPAGVVRIASLGDSCTLGGQESYSERLDRLLGEALGTNKYEVLNGGVGSSSTHQMLQIFEQQVLPMKPDWVVVFLGWNDRWVHDGRRDSTHRLPDAKSQKLRDTLGRSRLFKALVYYADKSRDGKVEQRVPPEETAKNLRTFAKLCRQHKLRLVLLTSPDGSPESMIRSRFDEQKAQRDWDSELYDLWKHKADGPLAVWQLIHNTYNDTVRQVAQSEQVELIDLDRLIPERRKLYTEPPHFLYKDGIHLTELGLQEIARLLAQDLLKGAEKDQLAAYLESPAYFANNTFRFATQYQFADAELFAGEAEKRGLQPPANWGPLKEQIAAQRPYYDLFNGARILLSNRGDMTNVLQTYQKCLEMRPDDQGVRLDLADLAKGIGQYELSLRTAVGSNVAYTPANQHRALWIGVEAANSMGRGDVVGQLLQQIASRFPQDQRARQILSQGATR